LLHQNKKAEIHNFASFRVQISGSRRVIATSAKMLLSYMKAKHAQTFPETIPARKLWGFFKMMDDAQIQDYSNFGGSVYWCTLGPKDMLYLPAGWVLAEKCIKVDDEQFAMGLVQRCFVANDESLRATIVQLQDQQAVQGVAPNPVHHHISALVNKINPPPPTMIGTPEKAPAPAATGTAPAPVVKQGGSPAPIVQGRADLRLPL
jgi:hypothetical protein